MRDKDSNLKHDREDALLEARDRGGVDWMDFDEEGGGPTGTMAHLGADEVASERDPTRNDDALEDA